MQKKIIALALAGLSSVAFAQSNVTVSGRFAAGLENHSLKDTTAAAQHGSNYRVSDQSSRIIFSGTEDLGGGLSAHFTVDSRFDTGSSTGAAFAQGAAGALGSGNTGVGLASKDMGKLTLGRWDVHYNELSGALEGYRAAALTNFVGNGLMSQVNGVQVAVGSRMQNVVKYDTPNWNGLTGTFVWTPNPTGTEATGAKTGGKTGADTNTDGSAWNLAVRYANGPMGVGLSIYNQKTEGRALAAVDQKSNRFWGSYTFPMGLKVGLGWDSSTMTTLGAATDTEVKRSAWMLPVSYNMGNHGFYFTYAKANNATGSGVAVGSDFGAKIYTLGYDYALSKRTSVGAYYTSLNNNSNATTGNGGSYDLFARAAQGSLAAGVGSDPRVIYFGMAHNF